jgi:fatty acid desaturase
MIGFPEKLLKEFVGEEFNDKLQALRRTDNRTNWYYLARTYAFLSLVLSTAVAFLTYRQGAGWTAWWDLPASLAAIILIGAGQHQLSGLAHEAAHRTLFQNRYLNDWVADWICSFPLFSSTYYYGLHHLAHHQFVNDPERDPDLAQLQRSGHRLDFPLTRGQLVRVMIEQFWLPNLMRYTLGRAAYDSLGTGNSPYLRKGGSAANGPARLLAGYSAFLVVLLSGLMAYGEALPMAALPLLSWAGMLLILGALPTQSFDRSRVHPLIPLRTQVVMRMTFTTFVFWAIAWGSWLWGIHVIGYFFLLWVTPLFTSFAFFMLLRQWVQHGNADRACLTNSRVFLVNPFVRFAVFPFGQDYHLPHHMFASVPHYRLKELHETLLKYRCYREQATVVKGYFLSLREPRTAPTAVEVMGPEYAPGTVREVFIDTTVLEQVRLIDSDRAELLRESALAARSGPAAG